MGSEQGWSLHPSSSMGSRSIPADAGSIMVAMPLAHLDRRADDRTGFAPQGRLTVQPHRCCPCWHLCSCAFHACEQDPQWDLCCLLLGWPSVFCLLQLNLSKSHHSDYRVGLTHQMSFSGAQTFLITLGTTGCLCLEKPQLPSCCHVESHRFAQCSKMPPCIPLCPSHRKHRAEGSRARSHPARAQQSGILVLLQKL